MEGQENQQKSTMQVMGGLKSIHDGMGQTTRKQFRRSFKKEISVDDFSREILHGSRFHLAKAITLIESTVAEDKRTGQRLLQELLPHTGNSIRIGITGVPGAGKSTFIEAFGKYLCDIGYKVAVLAIDPSSTLSGGSILGDKTRMEELVRLDNAFIRPSPTAGTLGGVHKKTRETMLLCEAAGYDVILIETVGVGQSETIVRGMVDFFMLLVLTGAGDELQGMKKGIMELADLLVVHKADGNNVKMSKKTAVEYEQILHFLQPATPGWTTKAMPVSSTENLGILEVWKIICTFKEKLNSSGVFKERRQSQTKDWFHTMITDRLMDNFYGYPETKTQVKSLEQEILQGSITVSQAVENLFPAENKT
ncbi:methylmalonyl Co-A mutase-associated GTPase MeaB [Paenisporosarcina sp. TG20]|uniref:methylmalonyl Co-A mutase-associated GTPase MeaB n=1 Tax=Paenisporosarcina sp. TG20 TaxID=1211706 RepID=UPI00031713CF|nr:methylmalonyl Co-A mutase-associated GTPase MeaB [Paenisporosarcina sp. TG20]